MFRRPPRHRLATFLLFALFALPAPAQEKPPAPKDKTEKEQAQQEEEVPSKLAARLMALRKDITALRKPDGATFAVVQAKVYTLAENLQAARCPAAAGKLLYDWSHASQFTLFRVQAALEGYARAEKILQALGDERSLALIEHNRGGVYQSTSRFNEALEAYARAERVFERLGDESAMAAIACNRGTIYQSTSRFEDALAAYARAEKVFERLGNKRGLAGIALNRGEVYRRTSRFDDALAAYDRAQEIFEAFGDDRPLASIALNRGAIFASTSRFEQALEAYARAEKVLERLGDVAGLAGIAFNRGEVYRSSSRFEEALRFFGRAEMTYQRLGDAGGLARVAFSQGEVYRSTFRSEEALRAYARAGRLYQRLGDNGGLAKVALNRGHVFLSTSKFDDALEAYARAERIFQRLGDEGGVARASLNRAIVYRSTSRIEEALEASARAETIDQRLGNVKGLAAIALNRGNIYASASRFDEALESYARAEKIYRRLGEEGVLAGIAVDRGRVYASTFRFEEALEAFARAEDIFKHLGDDDGLALISVNRGAVYQSTSRFDDALAAYAQAEAIYESRGDVMRLGYIAANRGVVFRLTSRFDEAIKAFARAATIFEHLGDTGNLAKVAVNRGEVYQSISRFNEALRSYALGLETIEGLVAGQVKKLGSEGARAFRESWVEVLPRLVGVAVAAGREPKGKDLEFRAVKLAFRALEVIEGRSVLEGVLGGRSVDIAGAALSDSEREELRAIRAERRELLDRRGMVTASVAKDKDIKIKEIVARLKTIDQAERQWAETVRLLNPLVAEAVYPKAVSPHEVQEVLPAKAALIELALKEDIAWGFVLTPGHFGMVELGDAFEIAKDLEALRNNLAGGSRFLDRVVLQRLSKNLLGPVLAELKRSARQTPQTLVFSLKGKLARIPVELLLTEDPGPGVKPKDFPFLVKAFDVAYVPSATAYVAMKKQAAITAKMKLPKDRIDFLAVGMPLDVVAEAEEEGRDVADLDAAALDPVLGRGGKTRQVLFGSVDEVTEIASLFATPDEAERLTALDGQIQDEDLAATARVSGVKGKRFKVLLRGGANEKAFKTDPALSTARFVHFAGHGEANLTSPSLSRLVLAQSPRLKTTSGEDGFLYFNELARLKLSADLLVLSACSTNDGVLFPTEGIMGLAQGGLLAGAKSVVSTLWRVNDEAAQRFMVDFYKRLIAGKTSRIHALSLAKRQAIAQGLPLATWSAYILWDAAIDGDRTR